MDYEVLGSAAAVIAALLWIRRDLRHDLSELRIGLRGDVQALTAQIIAVNTRIDNVLLANRKHA